jgi:hypothetical protein
VQWAKKVSNYFVYSSRFRLLTRKFLCLKLNCYVPDFGTLEWLSIIADVLRKVFVQWCYFFSFIFLVFASFRSSSTNTAAVSFSALKIPPPNDQPALPITESCVRNILQIHNGLFPTDQALRTRTLPDAIPFKRTSKWGQTCTECRGLEVSTSSSEGARFRSQSGDGLFWPC